MPSALDKVLAREKLAGIKRTGFTEADRRLLTPLERALLEHDMIDGEALLTERLGKIGEQEAAYKEGLKGEYGTPDLGDPGGFLRNTVRSFDVGMEERAAGEDIREINEDSGVPAMGDRFIVGSRKRYNTQEEKDAAVAARLKEFQAEVGNDRQLLEQYIKENPWKGLVPEAARSGGASLFSTGGAIVGGLVGGALTGGVGTAGGALAGRAAGAAAAGSFAYDTAYLQAIEAGLSHEQAKQHALMIAGTETAGEMVTLPGVKALGPVKNKVFGALLENPLQEAVTESMQQLGQVAEIMDNVNAVGGPDSKAGQDLLRKYEQLGTPKTLLDSVKQIGHAALVGAVQGAAFTPISVRAALREGRAEQAREDLDKLAELVKGLPKVEPTGDAAFDAGQKAGVGLAAGASPVQQLDLFGQPIDAEKQVQPELTPFDLEQRAAEAFRMSPAGREAKAREEFQAQEAAKRRVLEDNALRTGIRNRLTGQGIDRNIPAQGGLFGQDTPANEAERARSASATAMERTPRTLENVPEGPSDAVYAGGEVGPQITERQAMDRATEFDTTRQFIENDAEAVVKNRKSFFGEWAEAAAVEQANLEAKKASPAALRPFKQDGDTAQDLGDARARYAEAILPQIRKEEQARREAIYDKALDVVVTGRNRMAGRKGVQERAEETVEQPDLFGAGTVPADTAPADTTEQPGLFTEEQAPVPATQPAAPTFKSRLTAERERISPAVEQEIKAAEKAEKAARTKAANEKKAEEQDLVKAAVADVKKANPKLAGEELRKAVFERIEERRRTGNLPKKEDKKSAKKGPKNRLSKKDKKTEKSAENVAELRAAVEKKLAEADKNQSDNKMISLGLDLATMDVKAKSRLYEGDEQSGKPQNAVDTLRKVLQDPDLSDEMRAIAERMLTRNEVKKSKVTFVGKDATPEQVERLKNALGSHRINSLAYGSGSDILIRGAHYGAESGLHPVVILHEMLHAATTRAIADAKVLMRRPAHTLDKEEQFLVNTYQELLQIQNQLKANHLNALTLALGNGQAKEDFFNKPEELVTYGTTDPDVRRALKGIKEVWNKFIDTLRKMLGINPKYKDALEQVLTLSMRIESIQDSRSNRAAFVSDPDAVVEDITLESEADTMAPPAKEDTSFWRWFRNSKVRNPDGTPKVAYHLTKTRGQWQLKRFNTGRGDQQLGSHFAVDTEVVNQMANLRVAGGAGIDNVAIAPVYLRIENPLRLRDQGAWGVEVLEQLHKMGKLDGENYARLRKAYTRLQMETTSQRYAQYEDNNDTPISERKLPTEEFLQDVIKSLGYDGVVYLNRYEGAVRNDTPGIVMPKSQARQDLTDEEFRKYFDAYESYIVFDDNQIKSAIGNDGSYSESGQIDSMSLVEPAQRKDLDVVRNFDKNEAELSPELTGFRRTLATWLKSTQRDSPAAREAKDNAIEERAGQFVELSQSRNRMNSLLNAAGLKTSSLENIDKLKVSHPAIYNEYMKVRQITRALGIRLVKDYTKHNKKNMTDKDWAVMAKILNNEDYFRRTYKKNAPRGLGKKYAENLLREAAKNPDSEAAQTVREAKQFLIDEYLTFPETWDKTTVKHLRRMYSLWTGREPTNMKRDQIIESLEKYRNSSDERIEGMVNNWILDLLDLRGPDSRIASFYKPGAFNKSILLPRENIPQEIRNLWGENKDPLTKLYSTWSALAVAATHIRYLNSEVERGKQEGFLFDAEETPDFDQQKYSVQISGKGMGPLQDLYTTPRFKETMEVYVQAQEATLDALAAVRPSEALIQKLPTKVAKIARPVARFTKYLATVGSLPGNYIMNALGAPLNMIMNGNFNIAKPTQFYKNVRDALKGMKDAVAAYERKEINAEAMELLVRGILDSSFVGELQESERAEIEKEITSTGFSAQDRGKATAKDWWRASIATATDVYAIMDLYAKAANYYAEKDFLIKLYKRQGVDKSEEQIQKEAAERIKRTNLTYTRAAAITKALEGVGASMFLTYFGETYRAAYNNFKVGMQDVRLGTQIGDAQLVMHGTSRIAGATAVLGASKTLMALYALPFKYAFAAAGVLFGDDDDRERVIQEGMGDFYEGRTLSLLNEGENGKKSFIDIGRLDPNDPITTPLRHLARGQIQEAWDSVADLYVVNTSISTAADILARRALGAKETAPIMSRRAPSVYRQYFDLLTKANASPRLANEILNMSEKVSPITPPFATNMIEGVGNRDKPSNRNAMDFMGLRTVDYDPVDTVRSEYMRKVKTPTDNAMEQIREYLQFGKELEEGAVEEMYLDALADEYEGFVDAGKAVRGALASGASRKSLMEGLKQAGVSNEAATHLLNGRFVPRAFSDQFLDGVEAKLVQKAAGFSERAQAKQDIAALKRKLKIITLKYRNFIPEE